MIPRQAVGRLALHRRLISTYATRGMFYVRRGMVGVQPLTDADVGISDGPPDTSVEDRELAQASVPREGRYFKPLYASEQERKEAPSARALDAPLCYSCGAKMQPAGSCYVCTGCGSTSGCS